MKKLLLICCLSLSSISFYGQEGYYGEVLNSNMYTATQIIGNPSVQPPDVAAFQKVNFVPVSNYTGRANISIPIYSITAGLMNVPISLSYNTSGVKVADMASSVGLNWSLNAGGIISRMIKGMDDFTKPYSSSGVSGPNKPAGWLGYYHPNLSTVVKNGEKNPYDDAEPDVFSVQAPGLSTNYVHNGNTPIELEQQGNIINETIGLVTKYYLNDYTGGYTNIVFFGLQGVDITATNGIVYSFASPDASRHHGAPSGSGSIYKIESYRLDKMFDPSTNQTIEFEYEQYSNYFHDSPISKKNSYGGGTAQNYGSSIKYNVYPVTQRLKKIIFDKGEVEFIYGLAREDNTEDEALTAVKVKDENGELVKHIKLTHSYFQSSVGGTTAQGKRLRLDSVYEVDVDNAENELPGHQFTYDTSYQMPPRDSYAHDFLGYNNGTYSSSNTNPIPKMYFNGSLVTPFYNSSAIYLPGNYSLEANVNYAKSYSLIKVQFPTGGVNEYEYELNEFNYSGVKQGAGLRVKTQKLWDDRGGYQILDYTYENGEIVKMPTFAVFRLKYGGSQSYTSYNELISAFGIDTFSSPQSQIELTQNAFVGYQSVTVKNRVDNGYTIYNYTSPRNNPNILSTKTTNSSFSYSKIWRQVGPPALSLNLDFLRGKPTSEITYTKSGKKRISKTFLYTKKVFSKISLEYLNKSANLSTDNCYYDNGQYKLNTSNSVCGGYLEELDLIIQRHLLTKVITRDYQSDLISTSYALSDENHTLTTSKKYWYDTQYPLLLKEEKKILVCAETTQAGTQDCYDVSYLHEDRVFKEFTYPIKGREDGTQDVNTISSLQFANELVAKNRIATPLRITFKNKEGQIIAQEDHLYKTFNVSGSNLIGLEKINFVARDGSVSDSDEITKRDPQGRVLEYIRKDGVYVARVYGYDSASIVAEVTNETYETVLDALQHGIATSFNQGTMSNDESIRQIMNELRKALPNSQIISYTHKHLVGVNSVTDARGRTTYYHYDGFNRLEKVTDHEGNVVSKNVYHYKNQ